MTLMRLLCALLAGALIQCPTSLAADSARQLAIDTLGVIARMEPLLDGAIRSGSRADFDRFIFKPTLAMLERWPAPGDAAYDKFRRCHFALDAFRVFSDEKFSQGGSAATRSAAAKDYAEQSALCKKSVK